MWFRVFGTNDVQPEPAALLEHLQSLGMAVRGQFHGDDLGWFRAELSYAAPAEPLRLDRFLATEEDLRGELNAWAAWVETAPDNPHRVLLMQHMVSTTQLFTLFRPRDPANERLAAELCTATCRFLARDTAGVYQVDDMGFFAADGMLLLAEY